MRVQRLRGGGPTDDDSDGNGSDEECTPDARRVVAADPGTPVRSSKRHLTSELATASEETEEWRAFEEAEREARRWRTERRVAEQRARWEAAKQGTSGERTAAREAARSEAGRAAQRCTDKARSKRRRKAARALERGKSVGQRRRRAPERLQASSSVSGAWQRARWMRRRARVCGSCM